MTVHGDPDGVRSLHLTYGAAAVNSSDQGTQLRGAFDAIAPANFTGHAADNWRSYVGDLQGANDAMSKAFDRVGSFLPRVAEAIEQAQNAEKAEILAAEKVTAAKTALSDAETNLRTAEQTAASPLSSDKSPFQVGPTTAELQAVSAAATQVRTANHDLQMANDAFRRARQVFEKAEDHRQSILRQLTSLCHSEMASLQAFMPPSNTPSFVLAGSVIAELQNAEKQFLEIPAIAGSFLAPDLLPKVMTAVAQDARFPNFLTNIDDLYKLAITPLKSFVPKPKTSGGSSIWDWLGAGAVAVTSAGLIFVSAGTDTPLVLSADSGTLGAMGLGAGITGLTSESLAAGDALLHDQPIDPKALIIAGTTGWLSGAIPVGVSSALLSDAAKLPVLLSTRAAAGAVSGAGLNLASQEYMYNSVHWGTVAVAGAGGVWGAAWPGPGDITLSDGSDLIGESATAKIVLATHGALFPGVVSASTDNAGPAKTHHGAH